MKKSEMRIIGGEFRGRKLKQPDRGIARPTKDRIREAVFNVIARSIPGSVVLDIFAGSGAYGLEALSREAKKVMFIEQDRHCGMIIKDNILSLGVAERSEVAISEVFKTLEVLSKCKEKFDLVFSDPPYNTGMAKKTLIKINQYDILNCFGLLVIEHHRDEVLPPAEGNVTFLKKKTYAYITISIYSTEK